MRRKQIALSLALLISGSLVQGAAFAQDYRGTFEQQRACTPDVWRLCSDQIPDVNRIVACLRHNTPYLSNSCRAVFDSSADPQQPLPPEQRGRVPPPYGVQPPPRAMPPQPYPMRPPPPPYEDDDED